MRKGPRDPAPGRPELHRGPLRGAYDGRRHRVKDARSEPGMGMDFCGCVNIGGSLGGIALVACFVSKNCTVYGARPSLFFPMNRFDVHSVLLVCGLTHWNTLAEDDRRGATGAESCASVRISIKASLSDLGLVSERRVLVQEDSERIRCALTRPRRRC